MVNPIVQVSVSQTIAPLPSNLQKTGAFISQGGTVLAAGTYSFLSEYADLEALLAAPLALTTVTWANTYGGLVTATTAAVHGIPVNTEFTVVIDGVTPSGYNGTYRAWATGASTFIYLLGSDPGAQTIAGTYTKPTQGELISMARTFFGQRSTQGVYVLELGAGTPAAGVSELQDFIDASPQFFYSYLVPRNWPSDSAFINFLAQFESPTAKTYFFTTVNEQNYSLFTDQMKEVVALIEAPAYDNWSQINVSAASWSGDVATITLASDPGVAPGETVVIQGVDPVGYNGRFIAIPGTTGTTLKYALADDPGAYVDSGVLVKNVYESAGIPATEFTHASDFNVTLNYAPSNTNKVTPLAFSYLFGVTAFPTLGNSAFLSTIFDANVNYVGTGAEGGVSNDILRNGHTMDGRPFNYWYSVDWVQINGQRNLTNEIINGSNNPINPLYYNQDGINRLQQRLASTMNSAVTFGLALGRTFQTDMTATDFVEALNKGTFAGNIVINAIPFTDYVVANPSHYRLGIYIGLSVTFTPLRGFESITVQINVTDFVAAP